MTADYLVKKVEIKFAILLDICKKAERCKKELTNIKKKYSMKNALVRYRGEEGC